MARTQVTGVEIEDKSVEDVDLADHLRLAIVEEKTAGWYEVKPSEIVRNVKGRISLASKFEKHKGFISHKGYIKGNL